MDKTKLLVYNPARKTGYNKARPSATEEDCIFCNKDILDQFKIFETDLWVVRANAYPFIDGAVLLIPKKHVEFVPQLNAEEWVELKNLMDLLANKWEEYYHTKAKRTDKIKILDEGEPSYNFYVNNGPFSGQTQRHLHWHFIPRMYRMTTAMEEIEPFKKVRITPEETVEIFK